MHTHPVTIKDPQKVIEVGRDNRFNIGGYPVTFTYNHGKNGQFLQANVFCIVPWIGNFYLVQTYARPHWLDRSKLSKVKGRTIAAGRMRKFIDTFEEGADEITSFFDLVQDFDQIRVWQVDFTAEMSTDFGIGPVAHPVITEFYDKKVRFVEEKSYFGGGTREVQIRRESMPLRTLVNVVHKLSN